MWLMFVSSSSRDSRRVKPSQASVTLRESRGRDPSLFNCARVCKTWAPVAQRFIFRSVTLDNLHQALLFRDAVVRDTSKALFLRDAVRSLEISVMDEEDGRVLTQEIFTNILKLCPRLIELQLFYYCLRPLDYANLDILRTLPAPTALSIRCAQDPSPLWDLLTIWPTINHVEVVSWETATDVKTRRPSRTWAPYEVRWFDDSDSGESTFPWLLSTPGSLRILQLIKTPSNAVFKSIMTEHGPYLRSIRLRSITDDVAESVAACNSLEELQYLDIPSVKLLQALPDGLEHLQFQHTGTAVAKCASVQPVIDYITDRATALRVVTYNSCGPSDDEELVRMAAVCTEKGVILRCFADQAPLDEKEPLIQPLRFPRQSPISRRRPVTVLSLPSSSNAAPKTPTSPCCLFRRLPR